MTIHEKSRARGDLFQVCTAFRTEHLLGGDTLQRGKAYSIIIIISNRVGCLNDSALGSYLIADGNLE